MATLKFVESNGNNTHAKTTNHYICDGHGNERLARTNRYINDEHGLSTEVRGYGCPTDPDLATLLMADLKVQYEQNLAGRKTKGTSDKKKPVSHEHLIVSWHTDEDVPPAERHEMIGELIQRTKLRNFPCLVADHNNTDEQHIHISAGVFSLDGKAKLGLNNDLLRDWQRELDYICVEHGYSIVENPALWTPRKSMAEGGKSKTGDSSAQRAKKEEYKKWFDEVKASGRVTIHPQRSQRPKNTERKRHAAAMGYVDEKGRVIDRADRNPVPPMTDENRGTAFYCLPHLFDPNAEHGDIKQPLYIYALDQEKNRRPPMQLAFDLERQWCAQCLEQLDSLDTPGKERIEKRLTDTAVSAGANLALLERLDISTSADLRKHLKGIGKDLSETRRYIKELKQSDSSDIIRSRLDASGKREADLSREYRDLKKLQQMYAALLDARQWEEYTHALLRRAGTKLTLEQQIDRIIRHHFHDIGQLLGVESEEVDRIMDALKAMPDDRIIEVWIECRAGIEIRFARTATATIVLSEYTAGLKRSAYDPLLRSLSVNNLTSTVLLLPLLVPTVLMSGVNFIFTELLLAQTRQIAEEIQYHDAVSAWQLEAAQSEAAYKIACGELDSVVDVWRTFEQACSNIFVERYNFAWETVSTIPYPSENLKELRAIGFDAEDIAGAKYLWYKQRADKVIERYQAQINSAKAEVMRAYRQRMKTEQQTAKSERPVRPDTPLSEILNEATMRADQQSMQTPQKTREQER